MAEDCEIFEAEALHTERTVICVFICNPVVIIRPLDLISTALAPAHQSDFNSN